eukprot:2087038-Prymnesium_polylepis.1
MQAIDKETYLGWWGDAVMFDASNTGAKTVGHCRALSGTLSVGRRHCRRPNPGQPLPPRCGRYTSAVLCEN